MTRMAAGAAALEAAAAAAAAAKPELSRDLSQNKVGAGDSPPDQPDARYMLAAHRVLFWKIGRRRADWFKPADSDRDRQYAGHKLGHMAARVRTRMSGESSSWCERKRKEEG